MRPSMGVLLAVTLGACASTARSPGWVHLGEDKLYAVSGCALEHDGDGRLDLLVVHDCKGPGEPRIGRATVAGGVTSFTPLAWPAGADWPVDVESICAVPGIPGRFGLLASGGKLFFVDVAGDTVTLAGPPVKFPKPPGIAAPNYESFVLREQDGGLVAMWADRGEGEPAARLMWGPFDPARGPQIAGSADIRVPYPGREHTRDVADLKIDAAGNVWATATWDDDAGDDFRSAVYVIGVLHDATKADGFVADPAPRPVREFPDHKAEGIELLPGGRLALGADDESRGGWLLVE